MNVIIFRLPRDLSLVSPGSFCPDCQHPLSPGDNIPLLSYLLCAGKCRYCGSRISIRYPVVELITALVFIIHYEIWNLEVEFFSRTVFFVLVAAMAFIDSRHFIIPDKLSIGGLIFGLAISFFPGDLTPQNAFAGAALGGGILFGVAWLGEMVLKKEAMGMGDVKMTAMIGSIVGWQGVLLTIFLGSLLGTVVFGPLNIKRRRLIPFGVFLALGGLISIYFTNPIVRLYFSTLWARGN